MIALLVGLFWLSVALLAWVYAGYPLLALAYGRVRPLRLSPGQSVPDLVTVGIAVHDGSAEISGRIADVLEQAVPFGLEVIVASDGSTDATVDTVRSLAEREPRVRVLDLARRGQAAAQAAIFESARGQVIILTDAETRFAPGCLAALVTPFSDAAVGCVTGVLRWHYDVRTNTARHESLYWRYEQAVRRYESQAGWLSTATGALLAVRHSLFQPVPAHASLDQMLPLLAREDGLRVVVAAGAIGSDRGAAGLDEQFRNRVRIATQGIEVNLRMTPRLTPWRRPGTFLAIWSHKLLRWATPLLVVAAGLAGTALAFAGQSWFYLLPLVGALVLGVLAAAGQVTLRMGRRLPLTGFPLTIVAVNLAFCAAWFNVIARRRVAAWESA